MKDAKLWKVDALTGRAGPFIDTAKVAKSLTAIPTIKPDDANKLAGGPAYRLNPQRTAVLFTHADELYYAALDGSPAVRLTRTPGPKEQASFSPDGRFVGFVRGGNLFVVDVATQAERQLTTDGGGNILNGVADWVYGEEIFSRRPQAYWWSPDSHRIAFLRFDDTPVSTFTVLDQIPTRQKVVKIPYPKAGDPNPIVKLGVVAVAGGEPVFASQSNYSRASPSLASAGCRTRRRCTPTSRTGPRPGSTCTMPPRGCSHPPVPRIDQSLGRRPGRAGLPAGRLVPPGE